MPSLRNLLGRGNGWWAWREQARGNTPSPASASGTVAVNGSGDSGGSGESAPARVEGISPAWETPPGPTGKKRLGVFQRKLQALAEEKERKAGVPLSSSSSSSSFSSPDSSDDSGGEGEGTAGGRGRKRNRWLQAAVRSRTQALEARVRAVETTLYDVLRSPCLPAPPASSYARREKAKGGGGEEEGRGEEEEGEEGEEEEEDEEDEDVMEEIEDLREEIAHLRQRLLEALPLQPPARSTGTSFLANLARGMGREGRRSPTRTGGGGEGREKGRANGHGHGKRAGRFELGVKAKSHHF